LREGQRAGGVSEKVVRVPGGRIQKATDNMVALIKNNPSLQRQIMKELQWEDRELT